MISDLDNGLDDDEESDVDNELAPQTCFCFAFSSARIPGWCESESVIDTEEIEPEPAPFRSARRGRALRVLVIGASAGKGRVIEGLRSGGAPRRGAGVRRNYPGTRLIFNDVPSRDLDRPRRSADFEAYLTRAACALIVVDASDHNWLRDADRWAESLADSARVPVALLVDVRNRQDAGARASVEADAERMRGLSSLPFVGWFLSDDADRDETADCVHAIVDFIDDDPHDPRDRDRQSVDFLRYGSPAAAHSPPRRQIGRSKLSGGPRPSPGTYADNVNASISPYAP